MADAKRTILAQMMADLLGMCVDEALCAFRVDLVESERPIDIRDAARLAEALSKRLYESAEFVKLVDVVVDDAHRGQVNDDNMIAVLRYAHSLGHEIFRQMYTH